MLLTIVSTALASSFFDPWMSFEESAVSCFIFTWLAFRGWIRAKMPQRQRWQGVMGWRINKKQRSPSDDFICSPTALRLAMHLPFLQKLDVKTLRVLSLFIESLVINDDVDKWLSAWHFVQQCWNSNYSILKLVLFDFYITFLTLSIFFVCFIF